MTYRRLLPIEDSERGGTGYRASALDVALADVAAVVAFHARPLLRANRAILLNTTTSTEDHARRLTTRLWMIDGTLAQAHLADRRDPLRRSLAAMQTGAKVLLGEMIRRWPAYAVPPIVGIFTDGGGVAFSSEHPSPLSPDWLTRHQSGTCPTTTFLPFAPDGAWSRLIGPVANNFVH
ncbi:hypothetical protein [Sphingomonas echinoides]|uniref:hypothetical protein n=1 Tax=Sphingomonas echinoides TaxID=59803 RepID=UPI0024135869|nr:hypothetical protein [Sphingomonas echinoides]